MKNNMQEDNKNPTAAADALLATDSPKSPIKTLTIARYALLELADSPFIKQDGDFSLMSMLPSFWIMTREVEELKGWSSSNIQQLKDTALEWSESLKPEDLPVYIDGIAKALGLVQSVAPDSIPQEAGKKKAE